MKASYHDFIGSDCKLMKSMMKQPIMSFMDIYNATSGDPCTTGCAWYDSGKCKTYKSLCLNQRKDPGVAKASTFTNSYIAKKLGISKRQVSKMRKDGSLPEKYKGSRG